MEETDNIEFRSEKIRHIIGIVPPLLIRIGTTVITFMVIAMAVVISTIHYPITIETNGEIIASSKMMQARFFVPYKHLKLFEDPREATLVFEGSDKFLHMPITSHRKQLIHIDDKNYFEALIKLNKTYADSMQLQEHQKIEVRILISDKTIGQLLGF